MQCEQTEICGFDLTASYTPDVYVRGGGGGGGGGVLVSVCNILLKVSYSEEISGFERI